METEYTRSVKQSILDYVLLDLKEQRRLGLHMPQPVRQILHDVVITFFSHIWKNSKEFMSTGINMFWAQLRIVLRWLWEGLQTYLCPRT